MPTAAISIIMANGKALKMVAVCSAPNPPANNKAAATTPSVDAQNTRCHTGVSGTPPEANESMTSDPESDEVTKKVIIKITVIKDTIDVSGKCSNSLNSAMAWSACTSSISAV